MQRIAIPGTGLTLHRLPDFPSLHITPRPIDVWLPPGYESRGDARFPVLYMHDGQNLFDPALSSYGETWDIAGAVSRLQAAGKIRAPIVVGIWHSVHRWPEYMPERAFDYPGGEAKKAGFIREQGMPPVSGGYLRFITEELKPHLDSVFRTDPSRESTFVMGSSMGGLASLYALCERPDIFGGAGCLSTHWVAGDGAALDFLRDALPPPGAHRLYFDYGTEGLDAAYEPFQRTVDRILAGAGYRSGDDWVTRKFPGAPHNEGAWRERVHIPLEFLLAAGR